jgi:hypothetical protein
LRRTPSSRCTTTLVEEGQRAERALTVLQPRSICIQDINGIDSQLGKHLLGSGGPNGSHRHQVKSVNEA